MTKLSNLAVAIGLATLLVILVACGNGEAASSPDQGSTAVSPAATGGAVAVAPQAPAPGAAVPAAAPVAPVAEPLPLASGQAYSSLLQTSNAQVGIWVTGEGTVTLEPDLVLLNIGVETTGSSVSEARDEAAMAMDAVVTALHARDVEDRDIQTRFFNISPEYEFQEVIDLRRRTTQRVLVGYRISNSATIKIRDLDGVGAIIDDVATAGGDAIRIDGIRFTVEDPQPFQAQLREAAVTDALTKAQQFASLAGVSVGRLVFISESGGRAPAPRAFEETVMFAAAASAPATVVSGGELELRMTVQVVFDIQ